MNTSNYEKTIEHQFDSFCKSVLRNHARNIYNENRFRNERFISLEALTKSQLNQLSIADEYNSNYSNFDIHDYCISVENNFLVQALESLSAKQKDIILSSFFLGMSNIDIAKFMKLSESTIHYHKTNALLELKKFMEEDVNEG